MPMHFTAAPLERLLLGAVLAAAFSVAAWRAGALSRSGGVAASASGAFATAAGWDWATILVAYFVATSALGRVGASRKAARTRGIVAKGGTRDWRQVAANGGVFAAGALGWAFVARDAAFAALALGSLAAAAADSWGTEIGTLVRGDARSVLTFRRVPAGTSGGVTLAGTLATLAGAAFIAGLAAALGWESRLAGAAVAGGVAGALVDSVLGAVLQARRWCPRCELATERMRHDCGMPTVHAGGVAWLDNDAVNVACAVTGGLLAVVLAR